MLEGVFQDEHGDFPVGSYIRNPPQSKHTPGSGPGCVIFVKLWQFDRSDRPQVRTNINKIGAIADPSRTGILITPLYEDAREQVRVEQWAPHSQVPVDTTGGAELLVLEGSFSNAGESFVPYSWMRVPTDGDFRAKVGSQAARVWIKTGHLRSAQPPAIGP